MKISYLKLWGLLVERNMSRADLRRVSGISSGTLTKLNNAEPVTMEILWKICSCLGCNIGDIVEFDLS